MKPAIIETALSQFVAEGRELVTASNAADEAVTILEEKTAGAREIARARRIELGMFLRKVRSHFPDRGTATDGWGAFLEGIEMSRSTAHKFMQDAIGLNERATSTDLHHGHSEVDYQSENIPPPGDDEQPPDPAIERDEDGARFVLEAETKANRDAWCTPEHIANALPRHLDLDPCSNPHSIVVAKTTYMLERGENGRVLPWFGLVFVNGPYSNLDPFAEKLDVEIGNIEGAAFLVNADNSPRWWHLLTKHLHIRLDFNKRLQFIPPPGVEPSQNDRPQTMLMNEVFWSACDQRALLEIGTLWIKHRG